LLKTAFKPKVNEIPERIRNLDIQAFKASNTSGCKCCIGVNGWVQPVLKANEGGNGEGSLAKDRCYKCKQLGHWANTCKTK